MPSFYDEVERHLTRDLGWRIGRNLDAYNDVLRGGFGLFEYGEPIRLIWLHASKSRRELGYAAAASHWEAMLGKCHPTNDELVRQKIAAARRGEGPTLFDELVRIARLPEHTHLTLELR